MILDQLSNVDSSFYAGLLQSHGGSFKLGDRLMQGLRFLQSVDVADMTASRIELDGDKVFAMIQLYDSKPRSQGFWEAHRKYIDIQYVAEGEELMGYANLHHLDAGDYDAAKDFVLLQGEGSFVHLHPGSFIILGPEDAHMPQIAVDDKPQPIKKVVVKVAVDD